MSSARRRSLLQRAAGAVQKQQGPNERADTCRERLSAAVAQFMGGDFDDDMGTAILGSCLLTAGVDALLWVGFNPADIIDFLRGHLEERTRRAALGDFAAPLSLLLPSGQETGDEASKGKPS